MVLTMDLRQLREEIQALPSLDKTVHLFLDHWAKPLRSKSRLPSLQKMPGVQKKELHQNLAEVQDYAAAVRTGQRLQEKCHSYIHHLIELKLTTFNGNTQKSKMILSKFLYDEVFNFKQALVEQMYLEQAMKELRKQYHHVNETLHKHLSLEDALTFDEMPHAPHLRAIAKTVDKQKKLLKELGEHFIALAKETRKKK